jgi:hypothetical protein
MVFSKAKETAVAHDGTYYNQASENGGRGAGIETPYRAD